MIPNAEQPGTQAQSAGHTQSSDPPRFLLSLFFTRSFATTTARNMVLFQVLRPGYRTASRTLTATSRASATSAPYLENVFSRYNQPKTWQKLERRQQEHCQRRQYRRPAFNYQSFRTTQSFLRRWAQSPYFYHQVTAGAAVCGIFYVYHLEPVPVYIHHQFDHVLCDITPSLLTTPLYALLAIRPLPL